MSILQPRPPHTLQNLKTYCSFLTFDILPIRIRGQKANLIRIREERKTQRNSWEWHWEADESSLESTSATGHQRGSVVFIAHGSQNNEPLVEWAPKLKWEKLLAWPDKADYIPDSMSRNTRESCSIRQGLHFSFRKLLLSSIALHRSENIRHVLAPGPPFPSTMLLTPIHSSDLWRGVEWNETLLSSQCHNSLNREGTQPHP